ncbi:MAG: pentapeptide repeat-containing protein [Stenomitos rutilans HA7619-LM2]|jgi:curved DNA-binding protein CbpA|nr:pentapeptide repeat-containing protein [Stenomitos rutilans HA7619-LM2]
MSDFDRYYRVLGLKPGASLEAVNQAYRQLAFQWHPDRLPKDDPTLQAEAQEKLKALNQARDQLRSRPLRVPPRAERYADRDYAARRHARAYDYQPPRSEPSQAPSAQAAPSNSAQSPPSSSRSSAQQPANFASWQQSPQPAPANRRSTTDLSGTDWQGADLREQDFSNRNLSHANLSHANLSDAFLHKVNLSNANLTSANLFRANLLQADLRQANLQGANLIGADLSGADLSGADLRGAKIGFAEKIMVKFTGAILTGMIMPDGSVHV